MSPHRPTLPPEWEEAGLRVLEHVRSRGMEHVERLFDTFGEERARELYLAGAWLKQQMMARGYSEPFARLAACTLGRLAAEDASFDPWSVVEDTLSMCAPPAEA